MKSRIPSDAPEQLCHAALEIFEREYGKEHCEVAVILNNLAVLAKEQGQYQKATATYCRSLAILEKALGSQHPKVLTCRRKLEHLLEVSNEAENTNKVSHTNVHDA